MQIMPGETRSSVDLTVARSWPISISGTIAGIPDGEGRREAAVALVARRGLRAQIAYTLAGQEGAYTFANVPPGDYTVIAWWPFQGWESHVHAVGSDGRTAAVNVPVSSSNARIDLELRPVVQVEGQIVLDNANLSRSECRGIEPITFRSGDAWLAREMRFSRRTESASPYPACQWAPIKSTLLNWRAVTSRSGRERGRRLQARCTLMHRHR